MIFTGISDETRSTSDNRDAKVPIVGLTIAVLTPVLFTECLNVVKAVDTVAFGNEDIVGQCF